MKGQTSWVETPLVKTAEKIAAVVASQKSREELEEIARDMIFQELIEKSWQDISLIAEDFGVR